MFDSKSPSETYLAIDAHIEAAEHAVHCYSRLPMRQLLRHVSSNKAEMWWLSEHETPRSITPTAEAIFEHINQGTAQPTTLVVVEGIDWLVSKTNEQTVMKLMQDLDELARSRKFSVIFPVDSLSLNAMFWARLCSLAPKFQSVHEVSADENIRVETVHPDVIEDNDDSAKVDQSHSPDIVHLVDLPSLGFTHTILARRMLQWKRMGFDLSALEPALSMNDMNEAHGLYAVVERDIKTAIDGLRLLEHERERLTVTERELYNYRLMALNEVPDAIEELTALLSSR